MPVITYGINTFSKLEQTRSLKKDIAMYHVVTNTWVHRLLHKIWQTRKGSFLRTISNISKALVWILKEEDMQAGSGKMLGTYLLKILKWCRI
jgi:serine acetyltransferase